MSTHHRTCTLCEAHCGILVEVVGGKVESIRGDEQDPLSQGYLCPKAYGLRDMFEDPDRLRRPMIRHDQTWREVGWDEAIAAAARGLHGVERDHGSTAMGSYVGNPNAHNLPAVVGLPAFLRTLGGRKRFSASTVDQYPKMLASYLLYGAQFSIAVPDVDRSDFLMVMGANPVVSNGSLMTAPGMKRRLRALRERGGRVVVIDPRRSETAALADEHLFIRPGTDSHFLLALLNSMLDQGLVDIGAVDAMADGVGHVRELVAPFIPDRVASITGISAEDIRRVAREFATAKSSACYTRIGTCVQSYGTLSNYLGDVVNIFAGRLDREGGVMFPRAAASYSSDGSYKRWQSRVRGLPEFGGEIPVATLAEEIEGDQQESIRAFVTVAGNPVLSCPNGSRIDSALETLDFMVSVDPALNETTRHADVILPPRHSFYNEHYSVVFHKLAVRDTAKFVAPLFDAGPQDLSEWEILGRLSAELARLRDEDAVEAGREPAGDPAAGHFSASPAGFVEMLLAAGPYDLTLDDLKASPSGVDLGPLKEGGLPAALRHEDGRVHMVHAEIDSEVARLAGELEREEVGGVAFTGDHSNRFLMIGRRQLRSNNSWMHNCPSLMKGEERCTLLMHPTDAGRLGLLDGREVLVASRVGEITVPLQVDDTVMAGVVSLPHGFGHSRQGTRMGVASARPGASMNDLTDDAATEGLVGNGILTGIAVQVSAREPAVA